MHIAATAAPPAAGLDELHDVVKVAARVGFTTPVYLTRKLWRRVVQLPVDYHGEQSEQDRLWSVLYMAAVTARHLNKTGQSRGSFIALVRDVIERNGRSVDATHMVSIEVVAQYDWSLGAWVLSLAYEGR